MVDQTFRVCFVCTGNICRSPTAEAVLRHLVVKAGLGDQIDIDSAGTGAWHIGDDMDARSRRTLVEYGYDPDLHAAKQFSADLFAERDLVIALDYGHHARLVHLAAHADDPDDAHASIVMLRSYDGEAVAEDDLEVPDPYYGGEAEFREVIEQVERACQGLLDDLRRRV